MKKESPWKGHTCLINVFIISKAAKSAFNNVKSALCLSILWLKWVLYAICPWGGMFFLGFFPSPTEVCTKCIHNLALAVESTIFIWVFFFLPSYFCPPVRKNTVVLSSLPGLDLAIFRSSAVPIRLLRLVFLTTSTQQPRRAVPSLLHSLVSFHLVPSLVCSFAH